MKPPLRSFKLKSGCSKRGVAWLKPGSTYFGRFLLATRQVRVYAPNSSDKQPHLDVPYNWMVPVGVW